jgi:hypothetical protein
MKVESMGVEDGGKGLWRKSQFIQGLVSSTFEHLLEKNKLFTPWRIYYDVARVSRAG